MPVGIVAGGAAVGSIGSSIISGNKQANAITSAADKASEVERYIYDTTRAENAPWRSVGLGALGQLASMYGINVPDAAAAASTDYSKYLQENPDVLRDYQSGRVDQSQFPSAEDYGRWHYQTYGRSEGRKLPAGTTPAAGKYGGFFESPDYQFRRDEAAKAVERSASARGRLNTPATQVAVADRVGNLASSEYGNYMNRLMQLAGVGQAATNSNAQAGQNYASGTSGNIMAAGNARASSYANTGAAINSGIGSLATAYLYNKGYNQGGSPYGGNLGAIY